MTEIKTAWDLAWYGGIAIPLLAVIYTMLQGRLLTEKHHLAVVDELRKQVVLMTEDRDEWRTYGGEIRLLREAVEKLVEAAALKRRA